MTVVFSISGAGLEVFKDESSIGTEVLAGREGGRLLELRFGYCCLFSEIIPNLLCSYTSGT
jgi:hypothetical protein